jgi:hypothetical protein
MIQQNTSHRPPALAFGLSHDAWGQLVLIDAEGVRHVGVEPVRAFPITEPDMWISLRDAAGRELVCIDDISRLPPCVRQTLEVDLAQREFMPLIQRIVRLSGDTEPAEWEVETDRGFVQFVLKTEDDIRRLDDCRVLIVDAQGIRYLIANLRALDSHSQRILERYV